MRARCVRWLGLLVLAAPACGGSSSGGSFTPTTPVADVCSMLALSSVQTLLPGAAAGAPLPLGDTADIWLRGCAWQANGMSVSLIVEGPLTSNGNLVLAIQVDPTSTSTAQETAVSGVGDQAVYIVNAAGLDQLVNARKGSDVVSVAASMFTPDVPEASLQPLVVEALAKL